MAPASTPGLATRCTACGTIFRVVLDQLRISDGWVRCGRCSEVFNASTALLDLKTGATVAGTGTAAVEPSSARPVPGAGADVASALRAPSDPYPVIPAGALLRSGSVADTHGQDRAAGGGLEDGREGRDGRDGHAVDRSRPGRGLAPPTDTRPGQLSGIAAAAAPGGAAAEASGLQAPAIAAPPGPIPTVDDDAGVPSFLRRAERRRRWHASTSPRERLGMTVAAAALVLVLGVQMLLAWRDPLAARIAVLREPLRQACALLGCEIGAVRSIDDVSVESSGLVRVQRSSLYTFSVALRNRAAFDLALPALELSLTDGQGRLVARRVLTAAELGHTQTTLAAGRELPLQATVEVAEAPVTGYTIELFYP